MSEHADPRALDDTSTPTGHRGDLADRALVTFLTMQLSIAQERAAELESTLPSIDEHRAALSALAVATWHASRKRRPWRRRAEVLATRLRRGAGTPWRLMSRRELRDALVALDLFDADAYAAAYPAPGTTPLDHFLDHGYLAHHSPGPGFRAEAYLAANRDVADAGVNPLGHYLTQGWRECRPGVGAIALRVASRR